MSVSGRLDSTSHGAPLSQQQSQGLHGNSQLGGGNQMMQRSNQNPRLQGDGSFGLGGSAEVPEPTLDVSRNQTGTVLGLHWDYTGTVLSHTGLYWVILGLYWVILGCTVLGHLSLNDDRISN